MSSKTSYILVFFRILAYVIHCDRNFGGNNKNSCSMKSDVYFCLTFASMKAPSHHGWSWRKWPNGPWLPEQLSRTAFFESLSHQTELRRGCEEGKAQGSPAALWEQSGPPDADLSGGLSSHPDGPRCSVVYGRSDYRIFFLFFRSLWLSPFFFLPIISISNDKITLSALDV